MITGFITVIGFYRIALAETVAAECGGRKLEKIDELTRSVAGGKSERETCFLTRHAFQPSEVVKKKSQEGTGDGV